MLARAKEYHMFYMTVAQKASELSYCVKRKVGAVAVNKGNIIAFGFNGTPAGYCNCCEDENGNTKESVIHAEDNLLRKLKNSVVPHGTVLYVTKEPCVDCAELINGWDEIEQIFYREKSASRPNEGILLLMNKGKLCARI